MRYLVILIIGAVLGAAVMFHAFPSLRPLPPMPLEPEVLTVDTSDAGAVPTPPEPVMALPPQEPVPEGPTVPAPSLSNDVAADATAPPGAIARDVPPAREGYEPAQPGSIVPLDASPTAVDAQDTGTSAPDSLADAGDAGPPPPLAGPSIAPADATKAPIGPETPAAEPPVTEPVAPGELATAAAADEATDAPHEPQPKPSAVPTPVYLPQPGALRIPVDGVEVTQLVDTFSEGRGDRVHEAIDIVAPRGTPVVAVDDGTVVKLFDSKRGGLTVYQFDPTGKYAYYYAHLQGYAPGLAEGKAVERGDLIGYVGTTGNASPATPHLHFAVFALGPEKRWWQGTAINPYPLLGGAKTLTAAKD